MGTFTHPITLLAASNDGTETVDALVDTGATFTTMPTPILERLGVVPDQAIILRLANERREQRTIGELRAKVNGVEHTIICVFGEPDSLPVIGALTPESFLLEVDPVEKRLFPRAAYG